MWPKLCSWVMTEKKSGILVYQCPIFKLCDSFSSLWFFVFYSELSPMKIKNAKCFKKMAKRFLEYLKSRHFKRLVSKTTKSIPSANVSIRNWFQKNWTFSNTFFSYKAIFINDLFDHLCFANLVAFFVVCKVKEAIFENLVKKLPIFLLHSRNFRLLEFYFEYYRNRKLFLIETFLLVSRRRCQPETRKHRRRKHAHHYRKILRQLNKSADKGFKFNICHGENCLHHQHAKVSKWL